MRGFARFSAYKIDTIRARVIIVKYASSLNVPISRRMGNIR